MNAPFPEKSSHPLSAFGLDMLARGAARLRGERLAISEAGPASSAGEFTYRAFDDLVVAFAARAAECGLRPGDRAIVVGATRVPVVAAILGALSAGVEPIVAPAHFQAGAIAFLAQTTGAAAIFAPTLFGGLDMEQLLLDAAGAAPEVRIVGSLGPGLGDGAIDFSPRGLEGAHAPPRPVRRDHAPRIGLVLRPDQKAPRAIFLTQSAIVAQALDVVSAMRLAADRPIVTTLSPASVAGLVAGPVAALLAGAPLVMFGPFDAAGLAALIDRNAPCHFLAPEACAEDLARADLGRSLDTIALARPAGAEGRCRSIAGRTTVLLETDADGRVSASMASDEAPQPVRTGA